MPLTASTPHQHLSVLTPPLAPGVRVFCPQVSGSADAGRALTVGAVLTLAAVSANPAGSASQDYPGFRSLTYLPPTSSITNWGSPGPLLRFHKWVEWLTELRKAPYTN